MAAAFDCIASPQLFPDEPVVSFDNHKLRRDDNEPVTYLYLVPETRLAKYISMERALLWLDAAEQCAFAKIIAKARKSEYVYSRFLIKLILAHHLNCSSKNIKLVKKDKFGKLYVGDQKNIYFNLSHTEGLMALCVGNSCELGVDVEKPTPNMTPDIHSIASQHFCVSEARHVRQSTLSDSIQHFYKMWTLKEAGLKAIGVGLSQPMSCLDTSQFQFSDSIAVFLEEKFYSLYSHYYFDDSFGFHLSISHVNKKSTVSFVDTNSTISFLRKFSY